MTTATIGTRTGVGPVSIGYWRPFMAILRRDLTVARRDLMTMIAQGLLQPLFLLFVFGLLLRELGFTTANYDQTLFPGILALTALFTALQSCALPLVLEFSYAKEIEDRLLAPVPTMLVAFEKMAYGTLRALATVALMIPIGWLMLGEIPWPLEGTPLFLFGIVLGSLVSSAIGMTLGTTMPPQKINFMIALIVTPLLFTGCTQYPWPSLSTIPWFKVIAAFNPLTYFSELMRAALTPDVPHINPWISIAALLGALALFTTASVRGFLKQALN